MGVQRIPREVRALTRSLFHGVEEPIQLRVVRGPIGRDAQVAALEHVEGAHDDALFLEERLGQWRGPRAFEADGQDG